MAYWLFKEEPDHYSLEDLFRDKRTVWDGIENNLALVVDVKPVRRLDRPVSLAAIKANPKFADFALVRISRLSVMPVTEEQWAEIERLAKEGA